MLLAILSTIYYVVQTDQSSRIIIGISYAMTLMSIYWISANIRDVYRYHILRSDPQLNERIKRSLGGPSDYIRNIRLVFSIVGVIAAMVVFIIGMV